MIKARYLYLFVIILISTNSIAQKNTAYNYSTQKKLECRNGAVVSAHPLASKAGVDILKQGGNAIDAAIATQLALAVVYPGAGNIGGGGFMVTRLQNGQTLTLDYREKAPGKANRDMYLNDKGEAQTDKSQNGHLSSGVPGTIAGLFAAHKYAKLPFSKLIQPAIDLAEKGFVITEREASSLNNTQDEFRKYNTIMPVFVKDVPWKAGDTLVQKDLAATLKRIRDKGQKGFYEGKTAELIVAEMQRGKGIITLDDLKAYQAKWRTPMQFTYKGYKIVTMPLPSSGGIMLPQMLKMVENEPLNQYGFHSLQSVQLMTEVERRAFADRA
ncbi:MAG TPA: gamma-glutamyltransferase, partial [Chitinophagaceae bacterium]|nr:gamma-glutamyltransferase [Chitinophagaceae bacterium]